MSPKETPEEAGQRTAFYFITEYLPGVTREYDLLKESANKPLTMSFEHFQREMLIFGLHCLDRATFARRGAAYRGRLMDGAFSFARTALAGEMPEEYQDAFIERLDKLYNLRQREYGAWKLAGGQSPKGTLFWEFGRLICESAEAYNPAAVILLSEVAFGIFEMMNEIVEKTLP